MPHSDDPRPRSTSHAHADALTRGLARLRSRARLLLTARAVGLTVAGLLAAALTLALLDAWLRFPSPLRLIAWLAGAAALAAAAYRLVLPAARFAPSLTDVALRVERRHPELAGVLASAVDFAPRGPDADAPKAQLVHSPSARALAERVVADAASRFRPSDAADLLRPEPAARGTAALAVVAALALAPAAISFELWLVGAQRVVTPWGDAEWPKRTGVADLTATDVHPAGEALSFRAALTRSNRAPDETDVALRYRLVRDGQAGPERRELLTLQRGLTADANADGEPDPVFERLLEAGAGVVRYRLETDDDATDWRDILLVDPPAVASASATVTPPAYVDAPDAPPRRIELGPGVDERSVAPPMLAGSIVDLTVLYAKNAEPAAGALAALDDPDIATVLEREAAPASLRTRFIVHRPARLDVPLVDRFGITSRSTAVYLFDAEPDTPPSATVTEPANDKAVLATAVVALAAEARDDVALDWIALERTAWTRAGEPASGPGGALEPGEPAEITRVASTAGPPTTALVADATLDLAPLGLGPGDEVRLEALAADRFRDDAGTPRAPSRSSVRVLRIISEAQLAEDVRSVLSDVRQAAIRAEARQGETRATTQRDGASAAARRGQAAVSERISRERDRLDELRGRVRENRLDDRALDELLAEAAASLDRAGDAAARAGAALDDAAQNTPGNTPENTPGQTANRDGDGDNAEADGDDRQADEIDRDQERTEDELRGLIELLDRGEDAWVVRNQLERLAQSQRELRAATQDLAPQTAGRSPDELTASEREAVDRVTRRQDNLADELAQLLEEMRERAASLRESDPAAAAGISQALQRARQQQAERAMQQAAEQAGQNQLGQASQQQEQAAEALEQMLEDLDAGERSREAILRRALLSLIESIDALIDAQRSELAALARAVQQAKPLGPLDAGMIALNGNTLSATDDAGAAGAALAAVASLLTRASGAQERAISELRAAQPDADRVRPEEQRSLELLIEARAAAAEQEDQLAQRELERRKRELMQAYREALERQVALRADTEAFTELDRLTRRDRVRLRGLMEPQESIGVTLDDLLDATQELRDAAVYAHAHRRIAASIRNALDRLSATEPAPAAREQRAVGRTLEAIIASLDDPEPDESDFDEGAGGGGGGQGGGGENPADELVGVLGELRLLRSIQIELAQEVASVDDQRAAGAPDDDALDGLADEQRELAGIASELVGRIQGTPPPTVVFPDMPGDVPAPDPDWNNPDWRKPVPDDQPDNNDD